MSCQLNREEAEAPPSTVETLKIGEASKLARTCELGVTFEGEAASKKPRYGGSGLLRFPFPGGENLMVGGGMGCPRDKPKS